MRSLSLSSLLLQCSNAYTLWQVTETPRIVSLYPSCACYRMNTLGAVVIVSAKAQVGIHGLTGRMKEKQGNCLV